MISRILFVTACTAPSRYFAALDPLRCRGTVLALGMFLGLAACTSAPRPEVPPPLLETQSQMLAGTRALADDDYAAAAGHFRHALATYANLDHVEGQVTARLNLAETALILENLAAVEKHLNRAQEIMTREHWTKLQPRLDLLRASLALRRQDSTRAQNLLDALLLEPDAPCPGDLYLSALSNRVLLAFSRSPAEADDFLARFENALQACRGAGNGDKPTFLGRLERFKAMQALRAQDFRAAHQAFAQALAHYRRALYRPGLAATLGEWGELSVTQKNWPAAADRLHRALSVRLRLRDVKGTARVLGLLVTVKKAQGQTAQARKLEMWLELLRQNNDDVWERLREAWGDMKSE